jgi:hypothetical protein
MKLISHRGNVIGPLESHENEPTYIDLAIKKGFDVEVDVWLKDNILWLGHDKPDYGMNYLWFKERKDNLWIHTKNFEALNYFIDLEWARVFYHELEKHTIINNSGLIWSHDLTEANTKSIIPLLSEDDVDNWERKNVYGVCSDYVEKFK